MATTLEIIRGISQAASNAYDGSHHESYSPDGEVREIGLKREEGHPLLDSRVVDGFSVRFHGPLLCISYHSEIKLKEVYAQNLENEMSSMIDKVATFLKKEYKKITKNSLSLTAQEEVKVLVEHISRVRVHVIAHRFYKIGGLGDVPDPTTESTDGPPEANWQKFVSQGGWTGDGGKRPPNDTRKKE